MFWRAACANEGPPLVRHAGRLGPLNISENGERDVVSLGHSRHQPGVWLRLGCLVVEGLPLLLRGTGGHVVVGAVVEKNVRLNSEKRGSQLRSFRRVERRPELSDRCRSRSYKPRARIRRHTRRQLRLLCAPPSESSSSPPPSGRHRLGSPMLAHIARPIARKHREATPSFIYPTRVPRLGHGKFFFFSFCIPHVHSHHQGTDSPRP